MAIPLSINGQVFEYPVNFDENWGIAATGWAQAVTNGMLQRAGGSFPLLADVNFGASFGLLSQYYTSRTINPATAGVIRLAKTDALEWRNNANSANLPLAINGSDQLTFNGVAIAPGTVTSIAGTSHQIIVSNPTGAVTLSTPQNIDTTSSPTFAALTLSAPLAIADGGTGVTSLGNLTDTGTDGIVVTGGTGATVTNVSLAQQVANTSQNGYLASTDWNTFNNKQAVLSGTANEIIITGTVLSTPQPIATSSSPTFINETLHGVLQTADGSASAPTHSFISIPTSGLYNAPPPTVIAPAADWNTSTHEVVIANPYQLTMINMPVQLTTTGTLPSGFSLATTYYLQTIDSTHFALSATVGGSYVAFTTQGTGTHTVTPTSTGNIGISNNGVNTIVFTGDNRLGIGGLPDQENIHEMIHVEATGNAPNNGAVDIFVGNDGNSAARFIAQAEIGTVNTVNYLIAYGSGDTETLFSGGPTVANSCAITFQNAANAFIYTTGGGENTYLYNDGTHAQWIFLYGSAGTVIANITDTGIEFGTPFYPNRVTSTQRLALSVTAGAMVYDTTLNHPFYYNGTTWVQI